MAVKQQTLLEPYIGPQPFSRDWNDQKRFFGRDYEADEIESLILGHRLVLVYAQSGAGKTSIINAKVAPMLESYGFEVLPSARIGNVSNSQIHSSSKMIINSSKSIKNVYMLNAIQSLLKKKNKIQSLIDKPYLSDFLKYYYPVSNDKITGEPKNQVLVFDQMEELFTFYPDDSWREQQKDFFQQVAKALKNNPLLRIVFVIREDYLAELDPFLELLPERLRPRFRLERLRKGNALLAITKPLENINSLLYHSFEQEINADIDKIIEDLLNMKSIDPFTGEFRTVKGQFIEPIHLQIVCKRWWQKQLSKGYKNFSSDDNVLTSVDEALRELYESAISEARIKINVSEENIRTWCEKKLITPNGTRGLVYLTRTLSEDEVPSGVIDILASNYLIRSEWRAGSQWYELTHDRLIGPIKSSNQEWEEEQNRKKHKWEDERNRKKKSRNLKVIIVSVILGVVVASLLLNLYILELNKPIILPPIDAISVGPSPISVSANPSTNLIYVANYLSNTVSVIDGKTNNVINNIIDVESRPISVAINPITNLIYVANYLSNTVSVIDGKTNNNIENINVGNGPRGLAVNPNTNLLYVANYLSNTVSVIDGKTNNNIENINVGNGPRGLAINPNTNLLYVANYLSKTVSVIDGKTNKVVNDSITLEGERPRGLAVNPSTNLIYVANTDSNTVSVIDGKTNNVINNIIVGDNPISVAINPNNNLIYVANTDSGTVSVINGTTNTSNVIKTLNLGRGSTSISVNPNTNIVYAVNTDDNTVTVGDVLRIIPDIVQVGISPSGVAVNPKTNLIYVANTDSGTVSVIDGTTNSLIETVNVDDVPIEVAVNPSTNLIYVVDQISNTVSVIDGKTNKVINDSITFEGEGAEGIAVNPRTNLIYVANTDSSTVSVIDGKTNKVVNGSITIEGQGPRGIAVNPNNNLIYVANYFSNTVSVIDGKTNKVINDSITFEGNGTHSIAVNPSTNLIYVAHYLSNTVSVIDGKTNNVINNIIVGDNPISVAINPNTNLIYVANNKNGTFSVIDESSVRDTKINSVIQTLTAGIEPGDIAVNPTFERIYTTYNKENTLIITKLE